MVLESSGEPIVIGAGAIIFAGSVIRSVGGGSRPGFGVTVGEGTVVSPVCALAGCAVGRYCYIATGAVLLQGARLGDFVRIATGATVHAGTRSPEGTRIGMRHVAAPSSDGFIATADIETARSVVAAAGFFDLAFGVSDEDQPRLHYRCRRSC